MLQNDATFTNTLLVHGWRHRLYVKPEPQQSNQQRPRPHNGIPEGADFRNNSEFLWQGAHILPHSLEEEEEWNAVGEEARDGVW